MNLFNLYKDVGFADGTTCASGKSCLMGQCINDPKAPISECFLGDGLVTVMDFNIDLNLPFKEMKCFDVIQFMISKNIDFQFFCSDSVQTFGITCCDTCSSKYVRTHSEYFIFFHIF